MIDLEGPADLEASMWRLDHSYRDWLAPMYPMDHIHCSHPGTEEAIDRARCHGGYVVCPLCGYNWEFKIEYGKVYNDEDHVCEHVLTTDERRWAYSQEPIQIGHWICRSGVER